MSQDIPGGRWEAPKEETLPQAPVPKWKEAWGRPEGDPMHKSQREALGLMGTTLGKIMRISSGTLGKVGDALTNAHGRVIRRSAQIFNGGINLLDLMDFENLLSFLQWRISISNFAGGCPAFNFPCAEYTAEWCSRNIIGCPDRNVREARVNEQYERLCHSFPGSLDGEMTSMGIPPILFAKGFLSGAEAVAAHESLDGASGEHPNAKLRLREELKLEEGMDLTQRQVMRYVVAQAAERNGYAKLLDPALFAEFADFIADWCHENFCGDNDRTSRLRKAAFFNFNTVSFAEEIEADKRQVLENMFHMVSGLIAVHPSLNNQRPKYHRGPETHPEQFTWPE